MFMSREVIHCRPGKAKELVAKFKQLGVMVTEMGYSPMRIYTDVSGEQFWTVVVEQEIKTLDEMGEIMRRAMSDQRAAKTFEGYHDLVVDGRREFYTVE